MRGSAGFSWFCLLLALALAGFYFPFLIGSQSFYLSDFTYYFEPFCRFIKESLRAGQLPLWNRYLYCGMAQIAVPSPGIFYPPNWLFALLPFSQAAAALLVFHQWVAGLGAFLLVESLGWGGLAAAVAGATLALSGYLFSLQFNYTLVASAAWLPLAFWSLRRVRAGRDPNNYIAVLLSAGSVAMLLAAGRPEIYFPGMLILCAYLLLSAGLAFRLDRLGARALSILLWRGLALLSGVLLAMPSLLPAAEWAQISPRALGLSPGEIFLWSTNWYDLVCMLLPQPLGDFYLRGTQFLNVASSRPHAIPYLASAYLGPVVFTLALWGALDGGWKARPYVFLLGLGTLILALGNSTPIAPWLVSAVPPLSIFRYPVKLLIFPVCCLALMAARGAYLSAHTHPTRALSLAGWTFWLACLTFGLILSLSQQSWLASLGITWLPLIGNVQLRATAQVLIGLAFVRVSIIGLIIMTTAQLWWKGKIQRGTYAVLLLSMLAATLLASAYNFCRHGTERNFFEQEPYLKTQMDRLNLPGSPGFRFLTLYYDPLSAPPSFLGKEPHPATERYYQYGRQLLLTNTAIDAKAPSARGYEAAETADQRKLFVGVLRRSRAHDRLRHGRSTVSGELTDVPLARYCQMTSTEYAITQAGHLKRKVKDVPLLDPDLFKLSFQSDEMNVRIYRVKNALGRAYFPQSWRCGRSREDVRLGIIMADVSGFNPAHLTELEDGDEEKLTSSPDSSLKPSFRILSETADSLDLEVNLPATRLMVLADQYYPGWQATIDSQPATIYRANVVQRAIFVPAGKHLIKFVYRPASLYMGLLLAMLAVVSLGAIGLLVIVRAFKSLSPTAYSGEASRSWR